MEKHNKKKYGSITKYVESVSPLIWLIDRIRNKEQRERVRDRIKAKVVTNKNLLRMGFIFAYYLPLKYHLLPLRLDISSIINYKARMKNEKNI